MRDNQSLVLRAARQSGLICLLLLFFAALASGGLRHLRDGWAMDKALPVPYEMLQSKPISHKEYVRAALALAQTNPENGNARVVWSEADINDGLVNTREIEALQQALTKAPAAVRGWTLLSVVLSNRDPKAATAALSQALALAPYDFWVVKGRVQMAAGLWSMLDQDARNSALRQARLMWEEPSLRPQIRTILATKGGADLVTRAFDDRKDDLIMLNRWISEDRRRSKGLR